MTTQISDISPAQDRRKVTDHEEYFNSLFPENPVYVSILTGRYSNNPQDMLITTVGTGLAVCINDKELRIGGLAHLFIPAPLMYEPETLQKKQREILNTVTDALIHAGSAPERMKAKLFGCGRITETENEPDNFYLRDFARAYLSEAGIAVSIEEVGDRVGRRIHFFPKSGKAVRRLLKRHEDRAVLREREDEFNRAFAT